MRPLNIIVAVDMNGGFGFQGNIPWKNQPFVKDDFNRFKTLTKHSTCIMGYKTYQEIVKMKIEKGGDENSPLLPDRKSIVITSRAKTLPKTPSVEFYHSLRSAVEDVPPETKSIFVLGGEKLFIESLPWVNTIYLSIIKNIYQCDRFFPLKYIENNFYIDNGEQTNDMFFLTLKRK